MPPILPTAAKGQLTAGATSSGTVHAGLTRPVLIYNEQHARAVLEAYERHFNATVHIGVVINARPTTTQSLSWR